MALQRAAQIGAAACQIFVKNNMRWLGKPFEAGALLLWKEEVRQRKVAAVFGHTGYLINIAGPESEVRRQSIISLVQEIELAASLGLPFLVMHPGAHLGAGVGQGVEQAAAGLDEVFEATKEVEVRIALENTAGQGSCLGGNLRDLAAIFNRVKRRERLGVCIDTAHLFAAGYDIRSENAWNDAIAELDELVGVDQVLAVHLNDSRTDLGSRVDRHAHIGEGRIGREGFIHIVNDERLRTTPGCIETPKSEDLHEDRENLRVLRSLLRPKTGGQRGQKALTTRLRPARKGREKG